MHTHSTGNVEFDYRINSVLSALDNVLECIVMCFTIMPI